MRFTRKRDYAGTIRKVWNDNKTECYGLVGTVEDMLRENILEYCDAPAGTWVFFPKNNAGQKAVFADTRDGALFELG